MINLFQYFFPLRLRSLAVVSGLMAFLFVPAFAFGQSTPVEAYLSPPDGLESGDLVDLTILYGTEEEPSDDITEAHFEIVMPEGVAVAQNSEEAVDEEQSWFAIDENWYGTVETDPSGTEMIVSLYRRDEQPVRGHGEIAVIKGIIVDVGEIYMKGPAHPAISGRSANRSPIQFDYSVSGDVLSITDAPDGTTFKVVDLAGRELVAATQSRNLRIRSATNQILVVHAQGSDSRQGYRMLRWE